MKTVLITGVSRGIGKATAEKFLAKGWQVIGTSTSGKAAVTNKNLQIYRLDLSDEKSIEKFVQGLGKAGKKIDVLVNNAGIQVEKSDKEVNINDLRRTLEVNLVGTVDLTERLLPLINDGGKIINVSSALGGLTDFFMVSSPGYQISKAALNMYTKVLSKKLEKRNIIVAAFEPGWVKTDLGGLKAFREPSEPAEEIYLLATSPVESGHFWKKRLEKRNW